MKHEKEIRKCKVRAEASMAQAEFVASKCQGIEMICVHSPYEGKTGGVMACIHLYDEREAKAAFGDDGWVKEPKSPRMIKNVDGFQISYDAKFIARITFQDENQPAINRECETEAKARTALSEMLRQFASVKSGCIIEADGSKAVFSPNGDYQFTVPL